MGKRAARPDRWVIVSAADGTWCEQLALGPAELGLDGCQVRKQTLRGGLRDGVETIEVDNGACRVVLLPTRGMGIWRAWQGSFELGWRSPVKGPVHPRFVNQAEPSGLGWLAGFDELLCRCGLDANGGPDFDEVGRLVAPLHGPIANLPAHRVEIVVDRAADEIAVVGQVDQARLYHPKLRLTSTLRTRPGESGWRIHDRVTNLSGEPAELELLYHINFGAPLLEEGATVVVPAKTVVPATPRAAEGLAGWHRYGPPETGYTEQVYFFELAGDAEDRTEALLRRASGERGVSLHFQLGELPWFTLWKSTQQVEDGYVTGLEPGLNLPNPKSFEARQGRVAQLAAGQSRDFSVRFELHAAPGEVAAAEARIAALSRGARPTVHPRPKLPWAPE